MKHLYRSSMLNTHWLILLLANLIERYSLTFSCGSFAHIVDWRNRCDVAAEVLTIDRSNRQTESKFTTLTVTSTLLKPTDHVTFDSLLMYPGAKPCKLKFVQKVLGASVVPKTREEPPNVNRTIEFDPFFRYCSVQTDSLQTLQCFTSVAYWETNTWLLSNQKLIISVTHCIGFWDSFAIVDTQALIMQTFLLLKS